MDEHIRAQEGPQHQHDGLRADWERPRPHDEDWARFQRTVCARCSAEAIRARMTAC